MGGFSSQLRDVNSLVFVVSALQLVASAILEEFGSTGGALRACGASGTLALKHCPGLGGSPLLHALVVLGLNCKRAVEFEVFLLAVVNQDSVTPSAYLSATRLSFVTFYPYLYHRPALTASTGHFGHCRLSRY